MKLRGRPRQPFAQGAAVVAAIRPDDVVISGDAGRGNAFRAQVEIVEYLGLEDEVIVTLEGGPRLWVRTAARLARGDNVTVVLPPEKLIFLASE
jgi:putative spermidine/putrescine transport system ATP-binding protein